MAKLVLLRGYPGSGKSTIAESLVEHNDYVRVNRDDLRETMFASEGVLSFDKENIVTVVQRGAAFAALNAGRNVVVDDTNLRLKFAREWADFAVLHGFDFAVRDVDTSAKECIARDKFRHMLGGRHVGAEVIQDLARRFPMPWPDVIPSATQSLVVEPVEWDEELGQPIVLCDIDGTVAHMNGRSPYDWSKVDTDTPDENIIDLVDIFRREGFPIIFFSGRDSACFGSTLEWLNREIGDVRDGELFMRAEGDMRKDSIVKYELFNQHIRGKYNVKYVLDDRKQVVEMWRALGLTVLAVAEGNF